MTALFLGLCTAGLIVWLARMFTTGSARIDELPRRVFPQTPRRSNDILQNAGRRIVAVPGLRRLALPSTTHRPIGLVVVTCPAVAVISPRVALVVAVLVIAVPALRVRQAEAKRRRAIARDMPMIVDLLNLAVQSGLTVGAALAYVVKTIESPVSDAYRRGLAQLDQGRRLSEVLELCESDLGDEALALTSALLSAERYGSPLNETLAQLVQEARLDQERRAEQVARRLSVQLLFPVAGCILPAFALLTAAPLLAGSIGTLADSFH